MSYKIPANIAEFGKKIYSQNDEDGIIDFLARHLSLESGFFVEFGIGPPVGGSLGADGLEGNCRLLRERGWSGIFMDGNDYPSEFDVKCEFITALNINGLLKKYQCPDEIDVFSIDVDGQDFWIWMNLDRRPKIVVIEYNGNFEPEDSVVVPFNVDFRWDLTRYYGASLGALCKLAESKFYRPVYANGVNVFFVRDDLLLNKDDFPPRFSLPGVEMHLPDTQQRPWVKI